MNDTGPLSEEKFLRLLNERYKDAIQLIIERRCANTDETMVVLEKRVIAAEETSKAAIAQMTAVLAVLNVLAKYAGPPKGKP